MSILNQTPDLRIGRQDGKILMELSPAVYDMLVIELKFMMHGETFGKQGLQLENILNKRRVSAILSNAPLSKDLPGL